MTTNGRFAAARERLAKESPTRTGFWEDIMPRINQGIVIPIISNSFRIEQIFREEKDWVGESTVAEDDALSIDEQLTTEWANWIEYPMHDKHSLARVAQYYLVEQKDNPQARTKYLEFLKTVLLTIAKEDSEYADLADRLKAQIQEQLFSEIVHQLDYPRFPQGTEDSLRLLARLPLPIYITTSQSDFLERVLEAEGKKPRTQLCFWSGAISSAAPEHQTDLNFIPTITNPLVYHLFGLENYPQTLVQSEDDYINFIMSMVEDTNTLNPIVPLNLRRALGESNLLLLGYRLQDWDFRILFRFILKFRRDEFSPRGMVIQLKQDGKKVENVAKSLEYLSHYFDRKKFDIEWNNAEAFIQKLWHEWNTYRQGQS
ncbi:MAG: SIR2 family protein [Anaerolineales bacterium]|nr:SIR2 family protein [Anaerolineales bacterium]